MPKGILATIHIHEQKKIEKKVQTKDNSGGDRTRQKVVGEGPKVKLSSIRNPRRNKLTLGPSPTLQVRKQRSYTNVFGVG